MSTLPTSKHTVTASGGLFERNSVARWGRDELDLRRDHPNYSNVIVTPPFHTDSTTKTEGISK
jgi:hypothetical protein